MRRAKNRFLIFFPARCCLAPNFSVKPSKKSERAECANKSWKTWLLFIQNGIDFGGIWSPKKFRKKFIHTTSAEFFWCKMIFTLVFFSSKKFPSKHNIFLVSLLYKLMHDSTPTSPRTPQCCKLRLASSAVAFNFQLNHEFSLFVWTTCKPKVECAFFCCRLLDSNNIHIPSAWVDCKLN